MMKFVADHDGQSVEYILKDGINVIGRDEECDIAIDNTQISRNHVSVMVGPEGAVIQDLNSRNGTFVNGLKVTNTAQIKNGDVVSLGKYLMKCIADTPAQPEEQPTAPLTVEPPEAPADTLPFKGKYAKMMGGGSSESLPAKFDPSRYQIEVHGQRIIVTDPSTSQAIELYRGTPAAAVLDKLLADRRRRERRNILLGVGGGIAALVVIIVLAVSVLNPKPKPLPAKFDAKAYYSLLNQSVEAFNKNMADPEVNALLDKAEKVPGRSNSVTYHVQLKNIFRLKRDALDDALLDNPKKGGNWKEMLKVIETFGEMPDTGDISITRQFIEETKTKAEDEQESWEHVDNAQVLVLKFDESKAITELRKIDPRSIYTKEAQKMIDDLMVAFVNKQLKQVDLVLNGIESIDVKGWSIRQIDERTRVVRDLLNKKMFRNAQDRGNLEAFLERCDAYRRTKQQIAQAIADANALMQQGKITEAYPLVQPLENNPDPDVQAQVAPIVSAYKEYIAQLEKDEKLKEARGKVIDAYNQGHGEEALAIIEKAKADGLAVNEWLILQDKIATVIRYSDEAQEALETGDILTAKKKYENVIATEPSEANFYRQAAAKFSTMFDQMPVAEKVKMYVDRGRKMVTEKNYEEALDCATKADFLEKESGKAPGKPIRILVNNEGDRRRKAAITVHDAGANDPAQIKKAIEMLQEIIDKHIYADDAEGMGNSIYNGCTSLIQAWQQELPGAEP